MDNRLNSHKNDEMIEDALRTYPRAPLTKDLTSDVMSQIRQTSAPRFRITLMDGVVAAVLTLALAGIWFGLQSLPALVMIQLRIQGILLWQSILVHSRWLIPGTSIMVGVALAFWALINLRQPRRA